MVIAGASSSLQPRPVVTLAFEPMKPRNVCWQPPAPFELVTLPPVSDLGDLGLALRQIPRQREHVVGCWWWDVEYFETTGMDFANQTVRWSRVWSFGVPVQHHEHSFDPHVLLAHGLAPASVYQWARVARQHGVERVEVWPYIIPDTYHGQLGFKAGEDVGFKLRDGWRVNVGTRDLVDNDDGPAVPDGLSCEPAGGSWWTCRGEAVPAETDAEGYFKFTVHGR